MPEPITMGMMGAAAMQNPEVQNALLGVGRGVGRGVDYGLRGAGTLAKRGATGLADRLGGLGEQYLPARVNQLGGIGRQGLGYLTGGAEGLYNAITGGGQQMDGMPGQQVPGMQGQAGAMGMAPGGGQMTPLEAMNQQYMQQIQQPYQFNYARQQQQLMDRYRNELIPQMAERFAGAGGLSTGAFRRAMAGQERNLINDLAALEEQGQYGEEGLRQNRLGQMRGYMGEQQQLGHAGRLLAQKGTIAQRDAAIRQLGLMGDAGQRQQGNYINQLVNAINAQGGLGNIAMGQAFQPVQQAANAPFPWGDVIGKGLEFGARTAAAGGTAGMSEVGNLFRR